MIVLGPVGAVASIATVVGARADGGGAVDGGKAFGGGTVRGPGVVMGTVLAGRSSVTVIA